MTGQTLRTSIQVGFGLTQIGEFSFIIAGLGQALGVTSEFVYPIAVAVSLITTFITPYMIRVSHTFAVELEKRLPARVRAALTQYANWAQERQGDARQERIYPVFFQVDREWDYRFCSVCGFHSGLLPLVIRELGQSIWSFGLAWFGTAIIASPFIWGMWSAFRRLSFVKEGEVATNMARIGVTLFFPIQYLGLVGCF